VAARQLWHAAAVSEVEASYHSVAGHGLSQREAEGRLRRFGRNELRRARRRSALALLGSQFNDVTVGLLLVATAISYAVGERADATVILAIVCLNAVLGFVQEYRAERSLDALRDLAAPRAAVARDGALRDVPASAVVPGDVIAFSTGSRIPADGRLVQAAALAVEEAALTGESAPVRKSTAPAPAGASLSERRSMVYAGTTVVRGRGRALIVATGMDTEMGAIAGLLAGSGEGKTPLERKLAGLGRVLVGLCLAVCALVAGVGAWRGNPLHVMFMSGVSLAVAAVPEGLPAVVTVCLALGVQRMSRRRAIVRRLRAVETLGCATVICADKTGTMTKNEMTVREVYAGGRRWRVTGEGYEPRGDFIPWPDGDPAAGAAQAPAAAEDALRAALLAAVLCSDATLEAVAGGAGGAGAAGGAERRRRRRVWPLRVLAWFARRAGLRRLRAAAGTSRWAIRGDPTEGALVVAAAKAGLRQERLEGIHARVGEVPFQSERRRMAVFCRGPGDELWAYVKGAPDTILERCRGTLGGGGQETLDAPARAAVARAADEMAGRALRVLAIARRRLPGETPADLAEGGAPTEGSAEGGLTFLGLFGMIDPPRPEVRAAVRKCRQAGILPIMVTGDHPRTALAVAREVGLAGGGDLVVTGEVAEKASSRRLAALASEAGVCARVSPAQKLKLVRALRAAGHVVAMTGDGVNDAPAVKEADIGIAMGRAGTDVTREAAAVILGDDDFATIVAAVEEGRAIYDNIRRFIRYLLSCNAGEVLVMLAAVLAGLPLPLAPAHILWMNLVTDGLPAMALSLEPPDPAAMLRPPRPVREGLLGGGLLWQALVRGALIAGAALAAYVWGLGRLGLEAARTVALASLVSAQLVYVFKCRAAAVPGQAPARREPSAGRSPAARRSLVASPYLLLAVASSWLMLLAVVYVPALGAAFHTARLGLPEWGVVLAVALVAGTLWEGAVRRPRHAATAPNASPGGPRALPAAPGTPRSSGARGRGALKWTS